MNMQFILMYILVLPTFLTVLISFTTQMLNSRLALQYKINVTTIIAVRVL